MLRPEGRYGHQSLYPRSSAALRRYRPCLLADGRSRHSAQKYRGCTRPHCRFHSKRNAGTEIIRSFEARADALRLFVTQGGDRIKIELSPVLRGTVFPEERREFSASVEEKFGYVEMPLLSLSDLYAGKVCAALDRQHPRDLFDVKLLLENEGLTPELVNTFIVYLISHNRTMGELLRPVRKDIAGLYEGEFLQMAQDEVRIAALLEVREHLIQEINAALTEDQKKFLISFKSRNPDWKLLGLDGIEKLPAVRWKMQNLERMPENKHSAALAHLRDILGIKE